MRHRLAAFLRRLGRACFAMADRVQPDPITKALDIAYAPPADEARAWSDREIADEIRGVRDELAEHEFVGGWEIDPMQPHICQICGKRHPPVEIRGPLKPWHPEKLAAFQRRQKARR